MWCQYPPSPWAFHQTKAWSMCFLCSCTIKYSHWRYVSSKLTSTVKGTFTHLQFCSNFKKTVQIGMYHNLEVKSVTFYQLLSREPTYIRQHKLGKHRGFTQYFKCGWKNLMAWFASESRFSAIEAEMETRSKFSSLSQRPCSTLCKLWFRAIHRI